MGGFGSGPQKKAKGGGQGVKLRTPAGLVAEAKPYFRRLVRTLERHGLTPADADLLGQLAIALWTADQAAATLAREGLFRADAVHGGQTQKHPALTVWRMAVQTAELLGKQFGMTVASRARLGVYEEDEPLDELDRYLAETFAQLHPDGARDPYSVIRHERDLDR